MVWGLCDLGLGFGVLFSWLVRICVGLWMWAWMCVSLRVFLSFVCEFCGLF